MDNDQAFLGAMRSTSLSQRALAERAIGQVDDVALRRPLDANTNSIAIIMKHLGGSLRSRFVDFLTTDGEKPDRQRDREFVDDFSPGAAGRAEAFAAWDAGFAAVVAAIDSLKPEDLSRVVTVRGEPHSVPLALARALGHASYHVGQIVTTARVMAGADWTTITIPRGGSDAYNRGLGYEPKG